jgi:lipopolysaccharide transport system ATP-binding protein
MAAVIEVKHLTKTFRLYGSARARVMDSIGLGSGRGRAVKEKRALDDVSFTIERGERVAIIGSNGAGKSTLLKILTGVLLATEGSVKVSGQTRALLQIGAGFHPEMTGRENVEQYIAQFGVAGAEVDKMVDQVIAFAEVGDYIDQPVKVYSTGMGMRLMFAASTLFSPEILIIDEVLGVGDSYFAQKSFERIRSMCAEKNTTLLLVTHNIYDAERLCDRAIWIESGRVERDGEIKAVLAAYEARARDRAVEATKPASVALSRARAAGDEALEGGLYWSPSDRSRPDLAIAAVRFLRAEEPVASLEVGAAAEGSLLTDFSEDEGWGAEERREGRAARAFKRFGALRHRLPLALPRGLEIGGAAPVSIEVDYLADGPSALALDIAGPGRRFSAAAILPLETVGRWATARAVVAANAQVTPAPDDDRFGTRDFEILAVRFDGSAGEAAETEVGATLGIDLDYRLNRPDFDERPLVVFTWSLDGHNVCYLWNDAIRIASSKGREGRLSIRAEPLLVGAGEYLVTCSVYREGWLGPDAGTVYFAADRGLYDMLRRRFRLTVRGRKGGPNMVRDFAMQQPTTWALAGEPTAPSPLIVGSR